MKRIGLWFTITSITLLIVCMIAIFIGGRIYNSTYCGFEFDVLYHKNIASIGNDVPSDFVVTERMDLADDTDFNNPDWNRETWLKKFDYASYRPEWIDYSSCKDADLDSPIESIMTDMMFYLSHIDSATMKYLLERGWKIKLVPEIVNCKAAGVTTYSTRTITLLANDREICDSVLHEIGHALTFELVGANFAETFGNDVVNSPDFTNIYYHNVIDDKNSNLNNEYYESYGEEAVAESYVEYIRYPNALKKCAPSIYRIWEDMTKKLKTDSGFIPLNQQLACGLDTFYIRFEKK